MSQPLPQLLDNIKPETTVLFFGAGSSRPSGAPTGVELAKRLAHQWQLNADGFSLSELASLIEQRDSRGALVRYLRSILAHLLPTGGLLNVPLYQWKSIYTTNYDTLIEQSYARSSVPLAVYSSDFDFTIHDTPGATKLFKLHGTLDKDISDGHQTRLVISDSDYDNAAQYRLTLLNRLKGDLSGSHLVIIGYSLSDPLIRQVADEVIAIRNSAPDAVKVSMLLYAQDEQRALLFERRGLQVYFGGIDDFFLGLSQSSRHTIATRVGNDDPLACAPLLHTITSDVKHESRKGSNAAAMVNGAPAGYAEIVDGLTFERSIAEQVEQLLLAPDSVAAMIIGASGVGKTTAARQALHRLRLRGYWAWEHHSDHSFSPADWGRVSDTLGLQGGQGVLLVDDAHLHLHEVNQLATSLSASPTPALKLVLTSTRNHWYPRVKSAALFRRGREFTLARLSVDEVNRLIGLVDSNPVIRALVEHTFSGFSPHERRRRLLERCQADMFVCLKNIFASEGMDDILLREYATLEPPLQDVYRHVAALETIGVRVHRQMIIRLLNIPAATVGAMLVNLQDIVTEHTIDAREGIYGWRGRHQVIAGIIAKYKYASIAKRIELIETVIGNLSPTYEIEVRTVRELCNSEYGIGSIADKIFQNTLLRRMMSAVPGERVPRHRLIRNLIELGEFEKADTEIRIFEKDFKKDGPVARYRVLLLLERSRRTVGILDEDRRAILDQARVLAMRSVRQYPFNKSLIEAYCNVGLAWHRRTGDYSVYDAALAELKAAEDRLGDPHLSRMVLSFEQRMRGTEDSYAMEATADLDDE